MLVRNGAARKSLPEIPKLKGRSEWKGSPILSSKRLLLRVAEHSSFLWLVGKQTHLVLPRSRQVYQQVCTIWLFQAALALYVPHYRDCTEKVVQWQRDTVCAILILKSGFWVAGYKMRILTKLAVFVSSGVIEEHGIIVQQLDGLGCQHQL